MTSSTAETLLPESLPLSAILPEYNRRGYTIPPNANHQAIWRAVVNGKLPAQMVGRGYQIARGDMPLVEALLGLRAPDSKSASARSGRKTPATSAAAA